MSAIEKELVCDVFASFDRSGEGLPDELLATSGDVVLFPANGNSVTFTVTLKYQNGSPAAGKRVTSSSRPVQLTSADWRDVNALAPKFGSKGAGTIRSRVSSGVVRLFARVDPAVAVTDANGRATFRVESFHVCGNEGQPAADEITFSSEAGVSRARVKSAVEGLTALVDSPGSGLTTAGLVGRHMHPQIINVLKAIGTAWQKVGGKPTGMPNHVTVTGATMRWGGLNPPHMTHRFGGTCDIRPIGTRDGSVSVGDRHYHRAATGIIVDFLRQTGATEIRFAENLPGVTKVDASHKNHIHVSWLPRPTEPWLTSLRAESLPGASGLEPPAELPAAEADC